MTKSRNYFGEMRNTSGVSHGHLDGRWGWVVTVSASMTCMLIDGVIYTFGIFFPEFLKYFGETKGKTQLLNSIMVGIHFVLGPIVVALVKKYGCRTVAGCGAVTASVGLLLSSFSPNLDVMIICYSVVGGTGLGLMYFPAIMVISLYFSKRKSLATGITVCGAGIGALVFAPLSEFLLEKYDWRGTMWIFSAIIFNGVVFSASYRPPAETVSGQSNITETVNAKSQCDECAKDTCCQQFHLLFKGVCDSFVKSRSLLLYGMSCFFVMLGFFIPLNFLPAWANDVNLSSDKGAFLILAMGVSTTVIRVLIGYITDKPCANALMINYISLLIGGITTCFVPFFTTFVILIIYAILFGAVIGIFVCLRSTLMAELLQIHGLDGTYGYIGLCMGLSIFPGPPIAGALSDLSGNYNMTFYFAGISLCLGGLLCLPLRRISDWENDRNDRADLKEKMKENSLSSSGIESSVYTISE